MIVYREPNVITDETDPIINIYIDSGTGPARQPTPITAMNSSTGWLEWYLLDKADSYTVTIEALKDARIEWGDIRQDEIIEEVANVSISPTGDPDAMEDYDPTGEEEVITPALGITNVETIELAAEENYSQVLLVEDSLIGFRVRAFALQSDDDGEGEEEDDEDNESDEGDSSSNEDEDSSEESGEDEGDSNDDSVSEEEDAKSQEYTFIIDRSVLEEPPEDEEEEEIVEDDTINPRKYAVIDETREVNGRTLSRIIAVRDFGNVHAGELGGFIESEDNLSHQGNCWIYDEAAVMNFATVYDDAQVRDEAVVCDSAIVTDGAKVINQALVCEDASITDNSMVRDWACVTGESYVSGTAKIMHNALVRDADIADHACICDDACILDGRIEGHAYVMGSTLIEQYIVLGGFSRLDNRTLVSTDTSPKGTANVRLESLLDGNGVATFEKVEGENRYTATVYADDPLYVCPTATDPRSIVRVMFMGGDSFDNAVELCAKFPIVYPMGCIGENKDSFAIVIENPHYPDVKGIYVVDVNVLEPPVEEEPEEPPAIEDSDYLIGVKMVPECPSQVFEGTLVFDIPYDTTFTIVPQVRSDVTEPVQILFVGEFDISNDPTLTYPYESVGDVDDVEIIVPVPDSDDVVTYTILLRVVDPKAVKD